ncbi:MAG: BrnT family toxin [Xanthobacteraceae bacterium]|nr:MAG: BrnT family toxin [Xanthobacteraceae bacterium]
MSKKPFDSAKDAKNVAKHSVSLDRVADFVEVAVLVDDRFDYGETRYRAWGYIDGVAHCLAFTFRDGAMRPISLRRAHAKEMKRYVKEA